MKAQTVKLKNLSKALMVIRPNVGLNAKQIHLASGKLVKFNSVEEYSQYTDCCKAYISANKLVVVVKEDKEVVKPKKEVAKAPVVEAVSEVEAAPVADEPVEETPVKRRGRPAKKAPAKRGRRKA